MPRLYPSKTCIKPDCKKVFIPTRRNQDYCNLSCRVNFNNDKRRIENITDYALEKDIRRNEKILIKILSSPFYKTEEIKIEFLQHENFDFTVSSDSVENRKTGQIIRWCHTHGLEMKNVALKPFTIHKRSKQNNKYD